VYGFVLLLRNTGEATITWPDNIRWHLGLPPTLTTAGEDVIVCFTEDGGTTWYCKSAMKDAKQYAPV
jgi:hypothetical protein